MQVVITRCVSENRRVASHFFLISPDSQVDEALADPLASLRRGDVLNEK